MTPSMDFNKTEFSCDNLSCSVRSRCNSARRASAAASVDSSEDDDDESSMSIISSFTSCCDMVSRANLLALSKCRRRPYEGASIWYKKGCSKWKDPSVFPQTLELSDCFPTVYVCVVASMVLTTANPAEEQFPFLVLALYQY